jgi:Spy/CpxP family protein refolding chaperone
MTRRSIIGLAGVVVVGGILAGAAALAFGHGDRQAFMRRWVVAEIDAVLDEAGATAEQRQAVHAARDRVLAAAEQHWRTRRDRLGDVLAMFEADRLDSAQVEALRRQGEDEHRRLGDVIIQALTDAHDALTPAQRRIVADHVRSLHARHAMR